MTKYRAIIADPPWQYDSPRALVGGKPGQVQVDVAQKYGTMTLQELCGMRVPAADDCLLFLWTTNPFLADGSAAEVVKAWGFTPKSVLTWTKVQDDGISPSMKTGHWFRSASEHLIFATRGKVRRPGGFPALPTWFPHRRMAHSVKPYTVHKIAEQAAPEGPWLEIFARRSHPGWDVWGNQVDDEYPLFKAAAT